MYSRIINVLLWTILGISMAFGQKEMSKEANRIVSTIDSSWNDEMALIQEFIVHAPLDSVWVALTTKNGWEAAFVAKSEVNLKVGGTIKSTYDKNATIGDSTTIVNHIVNYVPYKLITLQAEISENFPEFMKKDAENFYNVIYLDDLGENNTKVISYGIGYKNTPKYRSLMKFFIEGNEQSYRNFIRYLETGEKVKF